MQCIELYGRGLSSSIYLLNCLKSGCIYITCGCRVHNTQVVGAKAAIIGGGAVIPNNHNLIE